MLETLKIKNLAVIDEAEIPFRKGLNILSGETGAGKSIVIQAIGLLLGERASADLIRAERDEAVIEGYFSLGDIPWMRERLHRFGFANEGSELLIKRIVSRNGRHRVYVNGELATLSILAEICEGLIDLCGQHEHQSLTKVQTQLELVDRYGGLEASARNVAEIVSGVRSLRGELERMKNSEADRISRRDFIQFQISELQEADLKAGEDTELQAEKKLLQSVEQRIQIAASVQGSLDASEGGEVPGAIAQLKTALIRLKNLAAIDADVTPFLEGLERSVAEAEEASIQISRYVTACDLNPERLETVHARLALIADLRRKYGATVDEMVQTLERLEGELAAIAQSGDQIKEIEERVATSEGELRKAGEKLSQQRKKVAKLLAQSVTAELKELKMEDALFDIRIEHKADTAAWTPAMGPNELEFLVQTNRGEPSRPIGKIASGGELSRLMLSIRRVIADKGGIGVYLFDEIDAGIGGQTALEVGKKLKSVAEYNQVICITHLPQVASFADHHLSVRKSSKGTRTLTEIVELTAAEKKKELSRMMGGPQMSKILSEKTSSPR